MPQTKAEYKCCLPPTTAKKKKMSTGKHISKERYPRRMCRSLAFFLLSLCTPPSRATHWEPSEELEKSAPWAPKRSKQNKNISGSNFQNRQCILSNDGNRHILGVRHKALPPFHGGRNTSRNQTLAISF